MVKLASSPAQMLDPTVQQSFDRFLDEQGTKAFLRAEVARRLYSLTEPRSRTMAGVLADSLIQQYQKNGRLVRRGYRHWGKPGKGRTLRTGLEVEQLKAPVDLILHTDIPGKWVAVDMETGELWVAGDKLQWVQMSAHARTEALDALRHGETA